MTAPAVLDVADGRIAALRREGTADAEVDAVLLPALVNAHAHLDLAGGEPLPATADFTTWLGGVGAVRDAGRDVAAAAGKEAEFQAQRGTVAVGDIDASGGRAAGARQRAGLQGPSFLEIVGVSAPSARRRLAEALALADRLGGPTEIGLSPHAPYSVATSVLPEIARAARHSRRPLAMHVAETPEETRYLLDGDGPFRGFIEAIGRGRPFDTPPGLRPVALAEATGLLAAGCLVIHGNDLDDEDIARLVRHRSTVVFCPGTHRHFHRPRHPLAELLAAGVNVALGTDSALSNACVDPWTDLCRLADDRPDIDPVRLLCCASLGGRIALGLDTAPARFEGGSVAEAVIVGPAPECITEDDARGLLDTLLRGAEPVLVLRGGRLRPVPGSVQPIASAILDTVCGHG